MRVYVVLAAISASVLWACGQADMPDQADGEKVYEANCEVCHGISGKGDGKMAPTLDPAPADLSTISRRNGGAFPVSAVLTKIDGYATDDSVRAAMPEFGAILSGELVPVETEDGVMTPTPRDLAALLEYLETLQR